MTGFLDDAQLKVPCPECGSLVKLTFGSARRSPTVRCLRGHEIEINAGQFDNELRRVDRALDDFQRTVGTLGRSG